MCHARSSSWQLTRAPRTPRSCWWTARERFGRGPRARWRSPSPSRAGWNRTRAICGPRSRQAVDDCLAQAGDAEIAAVGVSNQRESVVAWDRRTGEPAGPCITWQCRRTAPFCEELRARGLEALIRERSGLPVDPLFSASKARWLLTKIANGTARAAAGDLCIGTVDSWLLWNLTGGAVHATDASNASRTQLLNLRPVPVGRGVARALRNSPSLPAGGARVQRDLRSDGGLRQAAGRRTGGEPDRRFPRGPVRPRGLRARRGEGNLRHRVVPDESHRLSGGFHARTLHHDCVGRVHAACDTRSRATSPIPAARCSGWRISWASSGAEEVAALAATVPDSGGAYLVPAFAGLGAPHWNAAPAD